MGCKKCNYMTHKERYNDAHLEWFKKRYPAAYKNELYTPPVMPKIKTANGLTRYIVNILFWLPHTNGTRVASTGRLIDAQEKQQSGTILTVKKFIPGTTRKGTADVTATIKGRSVKWEVKIGKDRPSEFQLREQEMEQQAGGYYFFVHTPEEFWQQYDEVINSL
jgi:hypothetical protein